MIFSRLPVLLALHSYYLKITIFPLLFLLLIHSASPPIQAAPEYKYVSQWTSTNPVIDRDGTYDYAPTAFNDGTVWNVWYCGGGQGYWDSIYSTQLDLNGNRTTSISQVLVSRQTDSSLDGVHVCAPSVIKHTNPHIENGKEKFKMFFECAPRIYNLASSQRNECFTQICHAVSDDGIHWQKYNRELWNSQSRFGDITTEPSAVITIADKIKSNIGYEYRDGKHWANFSGGNTCDNLTINYGVGHPSAIVKNNQIWLWYFDSRGDFSDRGVYLTKSWDGFNFETPVKTNLYSPAQIKYSSNLYIATFASGNHNLFGYSQDGIHWTFPDYDAAYWRHRNLGETDRQARINLYADLAPFDMVLSNKIGQCTAPSKPGILSNKHGSIDDLNNLVLFSGEGYWGKRDHCFAGQCQCYNIQEDTSRGSTWGIHILKGALVATVPDQCTPCSTPSAKPKGDANCDGKTSLADFEIWRSETFDQGGLSGLTKTNWRSDFNCDSQATLVDFEIWRQEYMK